MKTAIFGGSFNPIHNGHVNLVSEIIKKVSLDRVIIMPTFISPFKKNEVSYVADGVHRLEMCRLAFEHIPQVEVSDYEISQADVSYTINTLTHFHEIYPNDELYFIMGSDMLSSLHKWYRFEDIMSVCSIIAASRAENQSDFDSLTEIAEKLREYGDVTVVPISTFAMSSSIIREKIIKNQDISCYVPKNVVKYIVDSGLYNS